MGLIDWVIQHQRDSAMRNALAGAYQPSTPAGVPTDPAQYSDEPNQAYLANQGQPASFDAQRAIPELARQGLGPEAIGLQQEFLKNQQPFALEQQKAQIGQQQMGLEYQLKRAFEQGRLQDAADLVKRMREDYAKGNGAPGADPTSLEISPAGAKIIYDPGKAATQRREDASAAFNFGYNPQGNSQPNSSGRGAANATALPGMTPKASAELGAKRAQEAPLDENKINNTNYQLDRLAQGAQALLSHPGLNASSGITAASGYIPGTDAYNFRVSLETLKNKIAFGALAAMKDASENGSSGLGRITNNEMNMLQGNIDALDRGQNSDDLRKSLQSVVSFAQGSKKQISDAYQNIYGRPPQLKSYTQHAPQGQQGQNTAPPAAVQYLKQNNSPTMRAMFQQKYGYLPD